MIADTNFPEPAVALSLLEQLPEAIVLTNEEHSLLWCNAAFSNIITTPLIKPMALDEILQITLSPVQDMKDVYCGIVGAEEKQSWYEKRPIELKLKDQQSSARIYAFLLIDITERMLIQIESKKLQEKLERLSTIDPISGLLNQRAMLQSLEPLVSRSRRYDNPLSLIAIHLCNLSLLATQHNQEIADEIVIALSHLLRDQLRWADIVCRFDTEQILVILPETTQEDALYLAKKILNQVNELDINDKNNSPLELQTCYGVSSWQKGDDSKLLLDRVNAYLIEANNKGPHSIIDKGK
ncbi:MAG: GGDEF domain-containing protein [Thiohalomonadales bacterium]